MQKSFCVRTHGAKTAHLPAEYIRGIFSTRTPSPFCAGSSWGLLSRKIFFDFYFSDFAHIHRMFGLKIFFEFYTRYSYLWNFFYFFYSRLDSCFDSVFRLSYLIISTRLKFVILYSILFFGIYIVSTRYKFCSIFTCLRFSYSVMNFDSYQFRLVSALSILCFNSSTLYLFNSSACYKQTSMLIRVCFMLDSAILRLSGVFLFVLGVVYRLGLK